MKRDKFVIETKRSLSSYVSKCTKILVGNVLLAILTVVIWTIPQYNAETDLEIKTGNIDKIYPLSKLTQFSTISDYWKAGAYLNAVAIAISAFIWPILMTLSLILIWGKSLYPSTRTKILLFMVLTSKLSLLTCFTEAILTYATYLDVTLENGIEITTTSSPVIAFGIFVAINFFVTVLSDIFFIWDQSYCHDINDIDDVDINDGVGSIQSKSNKYLIQNDAGSIQADNDKDVCYKFKLQTLAFTYKPQSYLGIISHSLFLTAIVCNTWILVESWYTVALRIDLTDTNTIRSNSLIEIPDAVLNVCLPGAVTDMLVGSYFASTIVSSMLLQFTILCVWFMPIYKFKYFNILIGLGFFVHSVNCYELYFISVVLTESEVLYLLFDAHFNIYGVILTGTVIIIHWFSLFYTTYIVQKSGIKVIRFNTGK